MTLKNIRRGGWRIMLPAMGVAMAAILGAFSGIPGAHAASGQVPSAPPSPSGVDVPSWVQQYTAPQSEILKFSITDRDHIWGSTAYGKVVRSSDGGQTWAVSNMFDPVMTLRGIKFVNNQVGWVGGEWHSAGVLIKSTDGGVTWQQQTEPSGQRIQAVEALDANTVMVVGGGTYYTIARRSTDGGSTWSTMPVPLNDSMFLDIFFLNGTTGWITGLDGGIAKTTDGGITWAAQVAPANWGLNRIHFSDANNGWAGGYYGVLLHTTNGGATWVQQNPRLPDYTHVLGVAAVSPTVGWISGYGGGAQSRPFVKKTTDGGNTWVDYTPAVGPYDSFSAVTFLGEDDGWAGGVAGVFHRIGGAPVPTATATATFTPTPLPTATATPAAPNRLVGHVTWQGRPAQPDPLQQLPVSITLKSGATEINFANVTTDASGFFTVSVAGLPDGTYAWRAKGPRYLAASGSINLQGAQITQQEMGVMRAGDANNDNRVNIADFGIVKNSFGTSAGQSGYDDRADFTGDQVINANDFNMVKNNFGQAGSGPLSPAP